MGKFYIKIAWSDDGMWRHYSDECEITEIIISINRTARDGIKWTEFIIGKLSVSIGAI